MTLFNKVVMMRTVDFQIPSKLETEQATLTGTYGKFVAEPFERGFGTTIGNSLRRILLSSITGAAVTSIKIEGVSHEFSTIPGVKEDVAEIVLNVKNIRLKLHVDKPKLIHIKKRGPCVVTAGDIAHDADVEVMSPDLHLFSLDKDARIDIEMNVRPGRGYVPAERNKEEGAAIGVIPIDAIFSPIRRVNCSVENARVGRMTDYDKLILEIWTDGGIAPQDALSFASTLLRNHLTLFGDSPKGGALGADAPESVSANDQPIGDLGLPVRTANSLKAAEIETVGDLLKKAPSELLSTIKNFGQKSLDEIHEALQKRGLSLAADTE
jgi:DNA-directed RNA polymerase subunit alpha